MKKIIFLILLNSTIASLLNQNRVYATDSEYIPNLPKILPVSPNAASLGQYGKTPISYYNGTTNINIPFYEIEIGGQKQSIAISYHSSGIKVAQEASWVGLGWSLNAGGCITRECIDGDDFHDTKTMPYYFNDYIDPTSSNHSEVDFSSYDTEPDIFYFNFGEFSGSMFFTKGTTRTPIAKIKSCNKYIEATYDINKRSWLIKDGNGLKYYFGGSSSSRDISSGNNVSHEFRSEIPPALGGVIPSFRSAITAWYVDSIVAPNHDKIEYQYTTELISTVTNLNEDIRIKQSILEGGVNCSADKDFFKDFSYSNADIQQCILRKIKFKNGEINFSTSNRDDISANLDTEAQKLEQITIRNNSEEIKSYHFSYNYLGNQSKSIDCRLLLNKITEQINNTALNNYEFTYNMGYLPPKDSPQIDFWGFYNNSSNPVTGYGALIPSMLLYNTNGHQLPMPGRDRTPNAECMQHGMLQSIKYPTGGTSQFTYEPHEFNNGFNLCYKDTTLTETVGLRYDETV